MKGTSRTRPGMGGERDLLKKGPPRAKSELGLRAESTGRGGGLSRNTGEVLPASTGLGSQASSSETLAE